MVSLYWIPAISRVSPGYCTFGPLLYILHLGCCPWPSMSLFILPSTHTSSVEEHVSWQHGSGLTNNACCQTWNPRYNGQPKWKERINSTKLCSGLSMCGLAHMCHPYYIHFSFSKSKGSLAPSYSPKPKYLQYNKCISEGQWITWKFLRNNSEESTTKPNNYFHGSPFLLYCVALTWMLTAASAPHCSITVCANPAVRC